MSVVLVYETSYRRLKDRIDAIEGIETIVMNDDRQFHSGGREIAADQVKPEAGWINLDLFQNRAIGGYLGALLGSPNLKWVQSAAAGFDNPVFGEIVKKGATLTTSNAQASSMAEYVLGTVLDHFQRGPDRRKAQAGARWDRHDFREMMGSRWLIVGYGGIGRESARRAKAFGAHITGVRRSAGKDEFADAMVTPQALLSELPRADVVLLSLPLSKQTENLVDAKFLAAMKPGSVLVNVGRGGLVDENALVKALDGGTPELAILDVFKTEPLPEMSPFWTHPRVVVTPHASAIGDGLAGRVDAQFVDNLRRFAKGEPLLNAANPKDVLGG